MSPNRKVGSQKHHDVSSSTLSTVSGPPWLLALSQSQNDVKGKCFESVKDIMAAMTEQLKTLVRTSALLPKVARKNHRISVFEAEVSTLRRINGTVSFAEMCF